MSDVTRILSAMERGDAQATDALLPLVYEELRLLAAQRLSRETPGQTLEATALEVLVTDVYGRVAAPIGDTTAPILGTAVQLAMTALTALLLSMCIWLPVCLARARHRSSSAPPTA